MSHSNGLSSNINLSYVVNDILQDFLLNNDNIQDKLINPNTDLDEVWDKIDKHEILIDVALFDKLKPLKEKMDFCGKIFTHSIIELMIAENGVEKYIKNEYIKSSVIKNI